MKGSCEKNSCLADCEQDTPVTVSVTAGRTEAVKQNLPKKSAHSLIDL